LFKYLKRKKVNDGAKKKTKFELFNLTQKGTPRWEKNNEELLGF